MKQNEHFLLKELAGVPYLLPYGQMIAKHRRGIKTNATGVYLWNLLESEHSPEEILSLSAAHYEVSEAELPEFHADITRFIEQLMKYDIFVEDTRITSNMAVTVLEEARAAHSAKACAEPVQDTQGEQLLSIGGLILKLTGPVAAFPPDFVAFTVPTAPQIHQTIHLHAELPQHTVNGQTLIHTQELCIIEQAEQYLLYFPAASHHLEIHLSKDGSTAHCYCMPPYDNAFHYDLFHAIRLVYLYLAQQHGMVALHSASILYKDKLWLFSGHSGMGKSTHTNLWRNCFGTPVINGDLNLLTIEEGMPVVHGIPWCGTSEIFTTKSYPLGGIVLLNKAPENRLEQWTPDKKLLLVSQRLISPTWTKEQWNQNLEVVEQISADTPVFRLHCTKEPEAAEFMKKAIDFFLS